MADATPGAEGLSLAAFAAAVAAGTPAPGGGAVAAVVAALAASLAAMVGRVTVARGMDGGAAELVTRGDALRERLLALAEEDARAYGAVIAARRAAAGPGGEAALQEAWRGAVRAPYAVLQGARDAALLAVRAAREGPPAAVADAVMAALLAAAVAAGSHINLRLNLRAAGQPAALRLLASEGELLLRQAQRAAVEARSLVEPRG